jgi:hypothetical protein
MNSFQKYAWIAPALAILTVANSWTTSDDDQQPVSGIDKQINKVGQQTLAEGRQVFRFDTFGDEDFWGGTLRLHQAIEGTRFGGVGPGVSPRTALAVGLKVDVDALPNSLLSDLKEGRLNLDDPAVTLELLRHNVVVGLTGFFEGGPGLRSIGLQCSLCHSTVDNSVALGIGRRLDGWANRDLNVGAIINLAPDLTSAERVSRNSSILRRKNEEANDEYHCMYVACARSRGGEGHDLQRRDHGQCVCRWWGARVDVQEDGYQRS